MNSYKIIDLTLLQIAKEVEEALLDYSEYFDQIAFSLPDFKQKLITSVLSKIPNQYLIVEDEAKFFQNYNFCYFPLEKRLHIENLIQVNIHSMFQLLELNSSISS